MRLSSSPLFRRGARRQARSQRATFAAAVIGLLGGVDRARRPFSSPSAVAALRVVVIAGTTRRAPPPRPILGPRICAHVVRSLEERGHSVHVVDPREAPLPLLEKPHFAYAPSQVPPPLAKLNEELRGADAYVAVTPEYNHAPSPALLNVLNHFGSSTFSFKREFS